MRWSVASTAIVILSLSNFASAEPPSAEDSLILSSGCGRFHLVLGRIQLDAFHYKKVRLHQDYDADTKDEEFVCVTARQGVPSLHYTRQLAQKRVTMDVMDANTVRILWKAQHSSGVEESLRIDQPNQGMLKIVSMLGDHTQEFETPSLWHFYAQQPVIFQEQIKPLLDLILVDFDAQTFCHAVDQQLQKLSTTNPTVTQERIGHLVDSLASPRRWQRVTAQRELAKLGLAALPILQRLDQTRLDAEQNQRIDQLRQRLLSARTDTPARVAKWLSTDRLYWESATRNWSTLDQQAASQYLTLAVGEGLHLPERTLGVQVADSGRNTLR